MNDRKGLSLWLRWVLANCLGEAIGLGATFAIGLALFSRLGEPQGVLPAIGMALLMTSSGLLEGTVVGLAQWSVMQRAFPRLPRRSWVGATVTGALVAWFLGSIPMTLASLSTQGQQAAGPESQASVMLLMAGVMGAFAGLVLGFPQWVVLRRVAKGASLWLPANGVAWALGMPMVFAAVDLAQKGGSVAGAVATMAIAVAITGAVVGAVHGLALAKLASQAKGTISTACNQS
jgi:hypothetical protein